MDKKEYEGYPRRRYMIPWFQYTQFHLGPIPIQVWGLFVAAGMCISLYLVSLRGRRAGLDNEQMLDIAVWMIIAGVIGARLAHVFFYEPNYFLQNPIAIVKIWQGGLSSFGGLVGALGVFIYKFRSYSSKKYFEVADVFSFCAVFGWMVGRVGCFMIHDHLGVHSSCPLSIQTPDGARLDMAFMEILGLIPLAVIFLVVRKKKLPQGFYAGILFLYYGILRFILDFFRAADIPGADARYFGLTPGQYFGIVLAVVGTWILLRNRKYNTGEVA